MKKKTSQGTASEQMRREAKERLAANQWGRAKASPRTPAELEVELDIHRVELELQNEHLRSAQEELEAGLDRYTQLFDFAPIGYATLAVDGTVREVNHAGAQLLAELRKSVLGKKFTFFLVPKYRDEFDALLRQVRADDVKGSCEVELVRSLEERPWVRVTARCLAGKEPTVLLAFEDVSAQKHAELALRQADQALREADLRKDEFLAVLSHELRTPLSAILMHAQLLQQGPMSEDDVRSSGEVIERATKIQVRLIDDLLDVSRIISGKLTYKREPVQPEAIVQAAVDAVSNEARKKRIGLTVSIDPTVPAVGGDPGRLQQAVVNLLTNAVKFTPEHGRVHLTLDEDDGKVRIEVCDNGVGMDATSLPRIFERFWQADRTTTRAASGLGLGLSIVHSIVEAHGGSVRAESPGPGQGSTFTIVLPALEGAPEAASQASKSAPRAAIGGARLLVVEDDPSTRATLMHVLKRAGADVRDADSAESAMKLYTRFRPEVLVCDIGMPKEDGCSLLRRARTWEKKRGRHVQAVAVTAFAGEESRARTRRAGFDEHLVKPVEVDLLLSTVSKLLAAKPKEPRPSARDAH